MPSTFTTKQTGDLDIYSATREDDADGISERWREVYIHGNPDGLRALARLLLELADHDQESDLSLPLGSREHMHLRPSLERSLGSDAVVVGRLDAKGTGAYYDRFYTKKRD